MSEVLHGVAELPSYIRLADKLLSAEERQDLIGYLAEHPKAGDIMEGTGGVRKLRWRRGGQGQPDQGRAQRTDWPGGRAGEHLERTGKIMSAAFENIKQGLQEAIAHAKGDERGVRVHRPREIDVKAVRAKVGMTQEQFAARFGFSTATLRHWERGDRTPHGPALVLLNVIERNPQAVIEALA